MKASQYRAARDALGWTHQRLADTLGVDEGTVYRYQRGEIEIGEPVARLLRALVWVRLTMPARKLDEMVEALSMKRGKK